MCSDKPSNTDRHSCTLLKLTHTHTHTHIQFHLALATCQAKHRSLDLRHSPGETEGWLPLPAVINTGLIKSLSDSSTLAFHFLPSIRVVIYPPNSMEHTHTHTHTPHTHTFRIAPQRNVLVSSAISRNQRSWPHTRYTMYPSRTLACCKCQHLQKHGVLHY